MSECRLSHTLTLPYLQQSHCKVSNYVKFTATVQTAGHLGQPNLHHDTVGGSRDISVKSLNITLFTQADVYVGWK